ncbi:MAG: nascent polypeptide-associated complex protein [Candidatus Thorarchaeota archaeon]
MVKLPKEMQDKIKSKPKRPQATPKREGTQFGSRQMRRRMQQQGIEMDQIEATRVIIEGSEKTLVLEQPEVVLMKQAGQEIYQIIGQAEELSSDDLTIQSHSIIDDVELIEETEVKPSITENDIMLVASQANVDKEEAETVLRECDGDIAKAILFLKNRP